MTTHACVGCGLKNPRWVDGENRPAPWTKVWLETTYGTFIADQSLDGAPLTNANALKEARRWTIVRHDDLVIRSFRGKYSGRGKLVPYFHTYGFDLGHRNTKTRKSTKASTPNVKFYPLWEPKPITPR